MSTTPGQTVGPFFGYALPFPGDRELVPPGHPDAIQVHGRVLDGAGDPVPDALVELWQSDAAGALVRQPGSLHRTGFAFTGWGRCATDAAGHYSFSTLRPGSPFFAVTVFARGLMHRLLTRAYLPDADDALLASLDADRRAGLVTTPDEHGLRFDIHLQGEHETVFLSHSPIAPGHRRD